MQVIRNEEFLGAESVFTYVRKAARSVSRLYDLVLSPTGLKASQYVLLKTINDAGEISQHSLSALMSASVTTLSRRLSSFRKRKLVSLRMGERGSRYYKLTPEGKLLLERCAGHWRAAEERLCSTIGANEWISFLESCKRISDSAKKAELVRMAFPLVSTAREKVPSSVSAGHDRTDIPAKPLS